MAKNKSHSLKILRFLGVAESRQKHTFLFSGNADPGCGTWEFIFTDASLVGPGRSLARLHEHASPPPSGSGGGIRVALELPETGTVLGIEPRAS